MPTATNLHYKSVPLTLKKAVTDDGNIKGYITTFGNSDLIGDVISEHALDEFIDSYNKTGITPMYGKALPMLWNHDMGEPIGMWKSFEKDEMGVIGVGKLYDVARAKDIKKILQDEDNTIGGLSIGFSASRKDMEELSDEKDNFMGFRFNKIMLHETSVVMMPAQPMAKITQVKSAIAPDGHIRLAEIEKMLRIGGLSKSQAKQVVTQTKDLLKIEIIYDPMGDEAELILGEEDESGEMPEKSLSAEQLGVMLKRYAQERDMVSLLKTYNPKG